MGCLCELGSNVWLRRTGEGGSIVLVVLVGRVDKERWKSFGVASLVGEHDQAEKKVGPGYADS